LGHLRPDSDGFGALKLTDSARGVLKGDTEVLLRDQPAGSRPRIRRTKSPVGEPAARSAGVTKIDDAKLQGALRAWRSEIARKRGIPAYVVLHDSTIEAIAAARPATLAQLRGIAGIGDKKLEHYGTELIALVQANSM
jgi:ATP-dependent DNA helicase RecQ